MNTKSKPAAKSATKTTKTTKTPAKAPAKKTLAKFTTKVIAKTGKALAKKPAAKVTAKKPAAKKATVKWFDAQVRVKYGELHIQAKKRKPVGEKSYWAFDATANDAFDAALGQADRSQSSMAGTSRTYANCQIALIKKGKGAKATQEVQIKIGKVVAPLTGLNYYGPLSDQEVAEYFAKL